MKTKKVKIFQKSFALLFFLSIFAVPNERETNNRGVAQLVSASGLGPEGPVFESQYPDIERLIFGSAFFYFPKIQYLCIYDDTGKRNRKILRNLEGPERNRFRSRKIGSGIDYGCFRRRQIDSAADIGYSFHT